MPTPLTLDWRSQNECTPFQDEDNYYITVTSEYETPGNDKESRLSEARIDGVLKLLKFYGKMRDDGAAEGTPFVPISDPNMIQGLLDKAPEAFNTVTNPSSAPRTNIFDLAIVEDYFVSYRPCVRMKVLVSVPKADFDNLDDDLTACQINKPAEGYLSAFIPVGQASSLISSVADGMLALVPTLLNSSNYISNVNIVREINRLNAAGRAIQRYIDLNNIPSFEIEDPECVQPNEVDYQLEIGFSFDYNAAFALVGTDQYTIGYDCFLETSVLNHDTTINYLINIREMLSDLQFSDQPSFNAFDFFTKYTIPVPVTLPKENNLDGLEKYDENGNLFSFANLAKLITLDLDINLCKTGEEKRQEDSLFSDPRTKANIARTVKQTKEFIGNNSLSTQGVEKLREKLQDASARAENEGGGVSGALNVLYEDVMAKVNFGCVLEETIQCLLENMITTFGQEVFDDPDLEEVLNIRNVSLGGLVNNCSFDRCDGTPDVDLKIGFPIFQGINIPDDLPTLDFLADTISAALSSLYNTLVSSLSSLILSILNGLCEIILSGADGIARVGEGLKSWLSQTLGIDITALNDPEAWKSALLSQTGGGFLGVIGKAASRIEGSIDRLYTQTGVSVNLPNPNTGEVENVFISPEFIGEFFSEVNRGADELNVILTPTENQAFLKGVASEEIVDIAYKCVTRNGSTIFTSKETFQDIMMGVGDILQPQFLTQDISDTPEIAFDYCDLDNDLEIRKEILKGKDSTLSSEEIDEIINKEKERKKNALLLKVDELNSYQAGGFAPPFPNIFGKGGLIPETPPVISEISNIVVDGALGGAVANFSSDAQNYSDIWKQLFGIDEEGEPSTQNIVNPQLLFYDFVGNYAYQYGLENGKYLYGYSAATAAKAPDIDVDPVEQFDILNGNETYIIQSFPGNFKKDSFRQQLTDEFFNGVPNDATEDILDFIEDKDEEDGEWRQLFFDPVNPLISYAILLYHEGGRTNLGADRLTEVILVKNEFSDADQPVTKKISYDYGNFFGTGDKSDFKTKITDTSWEGPLGDNNNFSDELADGLVNIANNDWDIIEKNGTGYVVGSATAATAASAGTAATAILWAAPALSKAAAGAYLAATTAGASGGVILKAKFLSFLGAATGPVGWAIAAAILIGSLAYLLLKDGKDIAQRIVIPEAIGGFVYIYDIIVSDKNNKVTVTERKISESLISRGDLKSPGWPNDIVTVDKVTSIALDDSSSTRNSVTEYNQGYTIGNTSTNLGLKLTTTDLERLSYSYTDETTTTFDYIIGLDQERMPAAAKALASLVLSSLQGSGIDATARTDIRKEIVEASTSGPTVQQLINNTISQMIWYIQYGHEGRSTPEKYWEYQNFDNINLSYPTSDILNYNTMRSFSQQLNSQLLNATFSGDFCDSLSTTRRVNASQSLVMMIRLLIVEQALITIQVYDKFDLAFMESDIFITNILALLFNETTKYDVSFGLTTNLYSDFKSAAKKYYEILALLGEQEPVEFETDVEYLKDIIKVEINNLKSPIAKTLNLGEKWKSWDGFVTNRLFPTFDAPSDIDSDFQSSFQTPPDSKYVSNFDKFNVYPSTTEVKQKDISDFVDDTKTSFKDSVGDSVPDELYNSLFNTFDEWISTLSLPTYDDISDFSIDEYGNSEEEIRYATSDTINLQVGVASYSVNYEFIVVGKKYGTYSGTEDAVMIYINATFDGELSQDYESATSSEAILNPFNQRNGKGGFAFERYVDYKIKTQSNVITGYGAFLLDLSGVSSSNSLLFDKFVEFGDDLSGDGGAVLNSLLFDRFEYIRFGYRMVYVADYGYKEGEEATDLKDSMFTNLSSIIENSSNSKNARKQKKAFYLTNQTRTINGSTQQYEMVTFPVASAECEYVDTTTNQDITIQQFLDSIQNKYDNEIFKNIKNMLLETDEYKIIINNVLCLKELIASLSFYEYASLSDENIFVSGINGINLHNMTARAKLSTLQTFYASIYGEGQISYQDPFTKNLLT